MQLDNLILLDLLVSDISCVSSVVRLLYGNFVWILNESALLLCGFTRWLQVRWRLRDMQLDNLILLDLLGF